MIPTILYVAAPKYLLFLCKNILHVSQKFMYNFFITLLNYENEMIIKNLDDKPIVIIVEKVDG